MADVARPAHCDMFPDLMLWLPRKLMPQFVKQSGFIRTRSWPNEFGPTSTKG
jgi:hypothetical protein